ETVAAHHGQGETAAFGGEGDPGVGLVVDEPLAGQSLDGLGGGGQFLAGEAGEVAEGGGGAGGKLRDVPQCLEIVLRTVGEVMDVHGGHRSRIPLALPAVRHYRT